MSLELGRNDMVYVDKTGLLVGSWFSGITFGIESLQMYHYLSSFPNDNIILKLSVAFLFSADLIGNILFFISTHRQLVSVTVGSIEEYIPGLTLVCLPFITSAIVAGVNLFLVWRYHRLTNRLLLCLCLCAIVVASFACHIWAASLSLKLRDLDPSDLTRLATAYSQARNAGKAGLSMETGLVCLIWLLVLGHLLGLLRRDMQDAKRIIIRLLFLTIESGTVASGVSTATLVYYLENSTSSNLLVLGFFMSRVYFMNMLFNLNVRRTGHIMRDASHTNRTHRITGTASYNDGLYLANLPSSPDSRHFQPSIVHVNQSVETKVDKHERDYQQQNNAPDNLPVVSVTVRSF